MSKKNNDSKLFEEFYIINADALDQTSSEINAVLANPACNLEGFLSKLEGFKTRCKNLHWAAPKNDVHIRLDEFLEYIDAFEDSIAEGTMGIIGKNRPEFCKRRAMRRYKRTGIGRMHQISDGRVLQYIASGDMLEGNILGSRDIHTKYKQIHIFVLNN